MILTIGVLIKITMISVSIEGSGHNDVSVAPRRGRRSVRGKR